MSVLSYKQIQALFQEYKKTGSEEAFKSLYMATSRPQYFIAYNYINDQYLAQEAVQNMYVAFCNNINNIENDMGIIEWMNRTTINMCHKLIEKEKLNSKVDIENYQDKIVDTKYNPEESYKRNDAVETLNKALNKLEPDLKQLIIYRYVDNLKIREISKITNLSTATINRYISKATMKLKKYIKNLEKNMYGLFVTPFMFRLFNNAMKIEFSNKQMVKTYSNLAKNIAFASSGATTGVVGVKIANGIVKKSSVSVAKVVGGTAAAVTTAGVAVALILPNYSIKMLNDDWVTSQIVSISSKNTNQISSAKCYSGENAIGELNIENDFTIEIEENGKYKMIIEDIDGNISEKEFEITNIDYELPIINVENKGNVYEATVSDLKSGIDYSSITIVDHNDNPIEFIITDNIITFTNSNPITKITVYDNIGNGKRITLHNE